MKENGVTRKGYVYTNFDEVDIVMMTDRTLGNAIDDGGDFEDIFRNPIHINEEGTMTDAIKDFEQDIEEPDVDYPFEDIPLRMDPLEKDASDYIDADNDMFGMIDTGAMIDIVAGL